MDSFPRGKAKFHSLEYRPAVEMPDDDYPFILTTGRVLEHWHGGAMTRQSRLDDLYPEAVAEINPADAARAGVAEGQAVRVSSRRGSIVLRARVTTKSTLGVVFIAFHFREAAANLLTIDALDPQAKIPEYKACAVRGAARARRSFHIRKRAWLAAAGDMGAHRRAALRSAACGPQVVQETRGCVGWPSDWARGQGD